MHKYKDIQKIQQPSLLTVFQYNITPNRIKDNT